MSYAIFDAESGSAPVEGKAIGWRAINDPSEANAGQEIVEDLPSLAEPVWGSEGPREATESERQVEPLYGMEGLYAELRKRKAANKPDPITTDELLRMMERVRGGEVR